MTNHYATLGISSAVTLVNIKKAFHQQPVRHCR
jgi:hypothetical protein